MMASLSRLLPWRRGRSQSIGSRGERLAARWLRRRGYRIVERNLRVARDEADIVALDPSERVLIVVEVKTRRDDDVMPEENVTRDKIRHLARLAARLQQSQRFDGLPVRFDVLAIRWPQRGEPVVRHHPAAFESPF